METAFYILVSSSQRELLEKLALNLTPDKPVFVEDVEPEWQALYSALEFVSWPRILEFLDEQFLLIGWSVDFDPSELASLVKPILATGAQVPIGTIRVEEGEVFRVETSPEVSVVYKPVNHDFFDDNEVIAWMCREVQLTGDYAPKPFRY